MFEDDFADEFENGIDGYNDDDIKIEPYMLEDARDDIIRIGKTIYYKVRKGHQHFRIVSGKRLSDLEYAWQVMKVDASSSTSSHGSSGVQQHSGKEYFLSGAGMAKWHLPDIYQTEEELAAEIKELRKRKAERDQHEREIAAQLEALNKRQHQDPTTTTTRTQGRQTQRFAVEGQGSAQENEFRARLVRFYQKYNPEKVSRVEEFLQAYLGDEEELFAKLVDKYGPEP